MHAQRRGFTLIEVSLAVAVGMVILAASIFAYQQVNMSSRFAAAKQMSATIQTNIGMEKFRTGSAPAYDDLVTNMDSASKAYWPGDSSGFPADPVMGVDTVATYDSSLAAVDLGSSDAENMWDHPVFLDASYGKGGWLYDEDTGAFRINLSNKAYPEQRPSAW